MKVNGKQLDRFIMREMNNLLKESQSWSDKNRAHIEKFNLENPRPAITKHGIRRQGDINNDMTDVILQGMKTLTGHDLKYGGEAFETEIRFILDRHPDAANALHDIFMEIRTGGGFNDEWYEERHQDDQELGEISEAVTKYGIQPQGRINGEIADIIIRGIKEVTGATDITGIDIERELRSILNREHDSTNDIWDIFMAVKSSLIDEEEETGVSFSGPEGVGGLDWSFDNTADSPIEGRPDEDLA